MKTFRESVRGPWAANKAHHRYLSSLSDPLPPPWWRLENVEQETGLWEKHALSLYNIFLLLYFDIPLAPYASSLEVLHLWTLPSGYFSNASSIALELYLSIFVSSLHTPLFPYSAFTISLYSYISLHRVTLLLYLYIALFHTFPSLYRHILLFLYPYIPLFVCISISISQCSYIPRSLYCVITISLYSYISLPHVVLPLCPYISLLYTLLFLYSSISFFLYSNISLFIYSSIPLFLYFYIPIFPISLCSSIPTTKSRN